LLLDTEIKAVEPEGTGCVRFTVQDVDVEGDKTLAAHVIEDIASGAVSESTAAFDEPLRDAVIIAVCAVGMAPVLAVKLAAVAVAATVTEVGNVRTLGRAPATVTEAPPKGAAADNVTVQVVVALEMSVAAVHCREEITGAVSESVAD